jgi:hypothetical protein
MANDLATERIMNGSTWADFCDALKRAGDVVLREGSPQDPFDRAEGFRYLSRLARVALESYVEFADPLHPVLHRPAHETVKMGADNPDNYYQKATISGLHEYRLWGTRGTVHYLGFGTYAGGYGSSARSAETGYVDGRDLAIAPDGSFEIMVSREARPKNWLRMEADTSSLIVRQTFQDRKAETIADLHIERLGAGGPPRPITPEHIDRALAAASAYVAGCATLFADWAEGFAKRVNELPRFDPAVASAAHGDPNICYFHGYWELGPDEALVIETTPPKCDYWNFQLNNHWMESLDYRYHTIAVNHHEATHLEDGSVRLVVAHENPGVGNWLDTAGHRRGTMCLRWVCAADHPQPRTRVVKVADLRRALD